jgi:dTDP-4-dehydrorhamnose 3,5-epimerase
MKIIKKYLSDIILLREESKFDEVGVTSICAYRDLYNLGIDAHFVQDNNSLSVDSVIRGLHYQIQHPQGKLIRVLSGKIYDVAVDLRLSSVTFGQHIGLILDADDVGLLLWIPPGFAHGFCVVGGPAEIVYCVTDYRYAEFERTLLWSDPALKIEWPIEQRQAILSEKDQHGTPFASCQYYS